MRITLLLAALLLSGCASREAINTRDMFKAACHEGRAGACEALTSAQQQVDNEASQTAREIAVAFLSGMADAAAQQRSQPTYVLVPVRRCRFC